MKIEDIFTMWEEDSVVDSTALGEESIKISKLHSKYVKLYTQEKLRLHAFTAEYKTLRHDKYEFFINPTQDKLREGWEIPAKGRLLKSEVKEYLDFDKHIVAAELKIGAQQEKVELLKSILSALNTRGFNIKNALEDRKFLSGS